MVSKDLDHPLYRILRPTLLLGLIYRKIHVRGKHRLKADGLRVNQSINRLSAGRITGHHSIFAFQTICIH